MTAIFRPVTEKDMLHVLDLAVMEARELNIDERKINKVKLFNTLMACQESAAVFATVDRNVISGFIALCPQESYWSDDIGLTSLMFYVHPEYRKANALMLLRAARKFAQSEGKELTLYLDTLVDMERKDKLFTRFGFRKRGGSYTLEVK